MDTAVIVAGAGPAGLTLAAELRLAGAEVLVLERLPEPTGESRGLGLSARTLEILDERGLLERFAPLETGTRAHFGGVPLDLGVLPGKPRAATAVPQSVTEEHLAAHALALGVDIRRGHELLALDQDEDGVTVTVRGPDGEHELRAGWLVGCDGGRSTVRKAAGFDFPGTEATCEMYLADLTGLDLAPRTIGQTVPGGMVMVGPLPGGVTRVVVCERGTPPRRRTTPPPFGEIAAAFERLTGEDISHATPLWTSAFGDAARQVTEYRRGRVLLAGDAAHIHLPAGGQGMNTGIQDAVNLGWKLAATVAGHAPPGLLDSYHEERHPVAARVLTNTRAQGQLILGGADAAPLREVLGELAAHDEVARHLAAMISGLDIRHDVGSGPHPLLGRRLPALPLLVRGAETTARALLRRGHGVLIDLADNPRLRARAAGWTDRVDLVTAEAPELPADTGLAGTTALLLRPDGHVAWAAPGSHHDLPMALSRWFGDPLTA
ncbi:FAD-dependent monooxygenase (plasmid) [Streptomyces sp. BI20]|uniref:FAD-dependent monooxygenase n=1 Tax=Streptomyces sp. BI20 TaxID=3403460 RepID=UPI003C731E0F